MEEKFLYALESGGEIQALKSLINWVRIEAFNFPFQKALRSPTEQMSHSEVVQCLISGAPPAVSWSIVALILETAWKMLLQLAW